MRRYCLLLAVHCLLAGTAAAAPALLRWQTDVARPQPRDWEVFQGETVVLAPVMTESGAGVDLSGSACAMWYQTNGMADAWWTISASTGLVAGEVRAAWGPTNDCGAARYNYFIAAASPAGTMYRAFGRLVMRHAPGAVPNELPLPARVIDFAAISVTNAPWTTADDLLILSNALAAAGSGTAGTNAWQNPASAAYWTWTSNGNEVTLTGYSGPNTVVIPDMLDGLPVAGFGGIFAGNTDITSIGGGANIKAVGGSAFFGCGALNSVSLPACTTVGISAFDACMALNSVFLPACTTVGDYAFFGCVALNSVSLPACTTVGNSAFFGCEALNSVTFGQNAPAPAANVFEYSTPTIYVSNPHATGWGDTWNGRPVVRAASMLDVAAATNALVQTYLLGTNAWMTISNQTLTISRVIDGVETSLWSSAESGGGGDTFDMAFINALWTALGGKADKAWGQYAPDGSANPDPAYMTYLNSPATMHASGFAWATSGAFSVLAQSGTVAFESGADGEARWGLDLHTNYVAFVRGSNVVVGASAGGIAVADGEATIVYAYTGGDFPVLWFAPSLDTPFTVQSGVVWVDNEDGTATVTAPAETPAGFWYASTTALIDVIFDVRPPARLSGGVFGAPGALPVVYDSVIEIESGGKTYRLPAQEVP